MLRLLQDIKYGLRIFTKNRTFTFVAVFTLAMGIGATTAIFSITDALVFKPLPFDDIDRLIAIRESYPQRDLEQNELTPGDFVDIKNQSTVFEEIGAIQWWDFNITGVGEPLRIQGFLVSPSFFSIVGVYPSQGRPFLPQEQVPGNEQVVILSYGLWQRSFGSDPNVVGKTISLNGKDSTIVGVMPADFRFPPAAEAYAPLALTNQEIVDRTTHYLEVIGKLKPGVSIGQSQSEMTSISQQLSQQYPQTNAGRQAKIVSLANHVPNEFTGPFMYLLLGTASFVLLLACTNVASLQLSRSLARQKEIAIRVAVGATRGRILRQLLTESLMLSLIGGLLGLLLSYWGVKVWKTEMPYDVVKYIPGWTSIGVDLRVLGFTLGVAIITGILFGLTPALQVSKPNLIDSLKEGKGAASTPGPGRLRQFLVVFEVALALVLLIGAGLMVRGFQGLFNQNQGFDPHNILTMSATLPTWKYEQPQQMGAFYENTLREVMTLPQIQSAAWADNLPASGRVNTGQFSIEGQPDKPPGEARKTDFVTVSPDYFKTLRISQVGGRVFTDQDGRDSTRVAVISDSLARRYWPNDDPIGKRIKSGNLASKAQWLTVVGVVGNIKHDWFDTEPRPIIYLSYLQSPKPSMSLAVRMDGNPMLLLPSIRSKILNVDGELPIYGVKTMEKVVTDSIAGVRLAVVFMITFGIIALILSATGVYGVLAYYVSQRTQEIGIRMALGAQRADVLKLIVKQGLKMTAVGLLVGLPIAFSLTRVMVSSLWGLVNLDFWVFAVFSLALLTVAILSSYIPARRASKVDPISALRYE